MPSATVNHATRDARLQTVVAKIPKFCLKRFWVAPCILERAEILPEGEEVLIELAGVGVVGDPLLVDEKQQTLSLH